MPPVELPPEELDDPPPPHPATSRAKSATSASRVVDFELGVLIIDASGIGRSVVSDERHHDVPMDADRHRDFSKGKPETSTYRIQPHRMGAKVDVNKARDLADRLEDEQILRAQSARFSGARWIDPLA